VRPDEIETAKLRLHLLAKADVDELHALWSSPEVRRYLWDDEVIARQRTASLVGESLRLFAAHGYGLWGVRLHDREELVGFGEGYEEAYEEGYEEGIEEGFEGDFGGGDFGGGDF
jgi:RimJ/RimL family protein N-acetyltransferase